MYYFYNFFFVPFALLMMKFLAIFSPKIREFLVARENVLLRWERAGIEKDCLWFHVASVGELEQIRPVLEALGKKTKADLVVSYYSTSVPRLVKNWSFVKYADYLPLDDLTSMRVLFAVLRPKLLVLNRYDLWPNHLLAAEEHKVPVALVNASTPPLGFFGYWSLRARRTLFSRINSWSFVDAEAASAWEPFVRREAKGLVAGNPRVDRAIERAELAKASSSMQEKLRLWQRDPFLVAGSTWPKDEAVLLRAFQRLQKTAPRLGLILVPHEPTEAHLSALEAELKKAKLSAMRFSALRPSTAVDVLLVDGRGYLAELYGFAKVAYVGGGFGREIHSVIEPLAHGVPVAFGPHHHRSPEAAALLALGAAKVVKSADGNIDELVHWFQEMLAGGSESAHAQEALRVYLTMHRGAGERVSDFLLGCIKN